MLTAVFVAGQVRMILVAMHGYARLRGPDTFEDLGIGSGSFCLSPLDILPDDLATMLLARSFHCVESRKQNMKRKSEASLRKLHTLR